MNWLRYPSIWWTATIIWAVIATAGPWTWPAWLPLELQFSSPSSRATHAFAMAGEVRQGQFLLESLDFLTPFLYVPALLATARWRGASNHVEWLALMAAGFDIGQNILVIGLMQTGSVVVGWFLVFFTPLVYGFFAAALIMALRAKPSLSVGQQTAPA